MYFDKTEMNGNLYEVRHHEHNDRQYVIYKNDYRYCTVDNYDEIKETFDEIVEYEYGNINKNESFRR